MTLVRPRSAPPHQAKPDHCAGHKARRAGALMVGHLLRDFQLAAIAQVLRDAGGAENVAANFCLNAGLLGPPSNHSPDI